MAGSVRRAAMCNCSTKLISDSRAARHAARRHSGHKAIAWPPEGSIGWHVILLREVSLADLPILSKLALPPQLEAADVLALRDQLAARVAAVLRPKGRKRADSEVVLPEGLEPLDALPPHIDLSWRRFDAAAKELQAFRARRADALANEAHTASDETEQNAANADADDRWRTFEQWNAGAASLSDDGESPSPSEARWLYAQLFPAPEGLRFITRRPRAQWTAMVQRMSVLQGEKAQAVIAGFGGARHMKQLAAAHARFGKAFGFTAAVVQPAGGPSDGRPQWVAAREALRVLLQRIEGHADPEIAGSEALVAFLLGPYVELSDDVARDRRRTRPKKDDPAPTPSP
ncbi:hypothetical protein [Sorangium sp. So ce1000]|uniref:hypothetical protein n=1 Tax=Sorangium sp. So ce1000 TaxID=3133325 RepID=UPI003F6223DA